MGAAIALRGDFDGPGLRRLAKAAKDAGQGRRCLALAEIYDGGARWDAARMSGVGLSGDPGLGAAFQWLWAERTDRPQGIGPGAQARRRATPGACTGGRERADPGDPCKCLEFHYPKARQLAQHGRDRDRRPARPVPRSTHRQPKTPRLRDRRLAAPAQLQRRAHQMDVHHRLGQKQNGPRLSRDPSRHGVSAQRVITSVQKY